MAINGPKDVRCWLFHCWTEWSKEKIIRLLRDGEYMGQAYEQKRRCQRCGALQARTVDPV